ncbi:MAG: hypothetical protein ACRELW_14835 [Candidatus Rokuibacteriota bacterium]
MGLGLVGLLTVAAVAHAQSGWVLWERPIDLKGEPQGAWHRRQVFEAERWCKGAMTTAINETLTRKKEPDSGATEAIAEYQCLPEAAEPTGAKTPR